MGSTPFTLRCAHCRKHREYDSNRYGYDKTSNVGLVPTGRTKKVRRSSGGRYGYIAVELKHEGENPKTLAPCNKLFWSTHPHAISRAKLAGIDVSGATNRNHPGGT